MEKWPRSWRLILRFAETLEQAKFNVLPYRATVPSFGEWGFLLASTATLDRSRQLALKLPKGDSLRFLDNDQLVRLFEFPPDIQRQPVEPNRWHNQILVRYYEYEWSRWN